MQSGAPEKPELPEAEWASLQGYVVQVLCSRVGAGVHGIGDLVGAVMARLVVAFGVDPLVSHEARCGCGRRAVGSVVMDSWLRPRFRRAASSAGTLLMVAALAASYMIAPSKPCGCLGSFALGVAQRELVASVLLVLNGSIWWMEEVAISSCSRNSSGVLT
jgi:hypothetical protein